MEECVAEQLTPQTPDLEVWGSSPARRVVSLDKKLYSTFSPLTQVYKWVAATYPIQEGVAIFLGMLKAKETGISSGCLGPWHVYLYFIRSKEVMSVARGWWILLSGEWILFLTCPMGFKEKVFGGIEITEVL